MTRFASVSGYLIAILAISLGSPALAMPGMVLYPITWDGRTMAKAGDIVEYSETNKHLRVHLHGGDVTTYGNVIPLDANFAPYRIYVELVAKAPPESAQRTKALAGLVNLADAAVRVFPHSPLREEIEAQDIRLTDQLITCQTAGKTTAENALSKARRYLAEFPEGRYRDEFEWKIVIWSNQVYETEGDAGIPLHQALTYAKFLSAHPNSTYAEEIKESEADAYRFGGDLLDYGPDAKTPGAGKAYRRKAEAIYVSLLSSKDLARAARARVALYNLSHGRVWGFGTPTSPPQDW